jgi:hypothetical protein
MGRLHEGFVCLECGAVFVAPATVCEKHGLDEPPYDVYGACPECSGAYISLIRCDLCDSPIVDDYIVTCDGDIICKGCFSWRSLFDTV